jgi:acetate kinase
VEVGRSLILISNPGSASRKYAVYENDSLLAELHFEWRNKELVYNFSTSNRQETVFADIAGLNDAPEKLHQVLNKQSIINDDDKIVAIGLRIVAPGSFFQHHHHIDAEYENRLHQVSELAPIHVSACLEELQGLREYFDDTNIFGVSDSAYHVDRQDYAKYYAIPLKDSNDLDIKRFGYHGLSISSAVRALKLQDKMATKAVIVHIGGGASVSAILNGNSIDNTMGYSPLEGLTMNTRSGSIDPTATFAIKQRLGLSDSEMHDYLNNQSGLLGLGGSSEIPELIKREKSGDKQALLALNTFIYNIQKGIAEMTSALGGIELLALTGTVNERSAIIRHHIVSRLQYLDFFIDKLENEAYTPSDGPKIISRLTASKPIIVVPTNESYEILQIVNGLLLGHN